MAKRGRRWGVLKRLGQLAECGAGVGETARRNQAGDCVPGVWRVPGSGSSRASQCPIEWPSEESAQALGQGQGRDFAGAEGKVGEAQKRAGIESGSGRIVIGAGRCLSLTVGQ